VEARKALLSSQGLDPHFHHPTQDKKEAAATTTTTNTTTSTFPTHQLVSLVATGLNAGLALQIDLNEFQCVDTLNYDIPYLYRREGGAGYFPDLSVDDNDAMSEYDQIRVLRHFLGFAVTRLQVSGGDDVGGLSLLLLLLLPPPS